MRFIIENVNPDYARELKKFIKDHPLLRTIDLSDVIIKIDWVEVSRHGLGREEELQLIISFNIPELHVREDRVMRVFTSAFEGTGLIFSSPDLNGFRFQIA